MFLPEKFQIAFFSLIIVFSFLIVSPLAWAADAETGVDKALGGLDSTARVGGIEATNTDLPLIIGKVVGAILAFLGAVFFGLILWAGMGWMLAKGNEEEITKAKETIFGAVLGIMVVLGAYAITRLIAFIFSNALG
jgi:TRAP-type C4-dicarboxylate transport system permease small subunit